MLDSLVRVSRRVGENHFARIAKTQIQHTSSTTPCTAPRFILDGFRNRRQVIVCQKRRALSIPQSLPMYGQRVFRSRSYLPSPRFSPPKIIDPDHPTELQQKPQTAKKEALRTPNTTISDNYKNERVLLVSYASFLAISGTYSPSFQRTFHLSLTVLVRYRSRAVI